MPEVRVQARIEYQQAAWLNLIDSDGHVAIERAHIDFHLCPETRDVTQDGEGIHEQEDVDVAVRVDNETDELMG